MSDSTFSFVEILRRHAATDPDRWALSFLDHGEEETARLTCAELDRRARAVAAMLAAAGASGERVLLLYPAGLEFVVAFCGCLYAGAVAVPAYPPKLNRHPGRLRSILTDARPRLILTTSLLERRRQAFAASLPELAAPVWIASDTIDPGAADDWRDPEATPETLAFLQYTSGSTSTPRGVMVRHGNLLANERMIRDAFQMTGDSLVVGWLPLYHDMGLIGNVLQPLYSGAPAVLMPPLAFLQSPDRWLRAISRYGGTTSGGPDFAYRFCTERMREASCRDLDLSRWRVAYNGSEPVRGETLARFAERFAPYGFSAEAFYPCYGLAEATLFVSGGEVGNPVTSMAVKAEELKRHRVVPVEGAEDARQWIGCGHSRLDGEIAIASPETLAECAAGEVGEIWVAGPHVAAGYWGRPDDSARTFGARLSGGGADSGRGPFLRTGDLGFQSGGELFVTGRIKDLIILRGENHYPQDLEMTAERSHPGFVAGGAAAFLTADERLVIVQEVRNGAAVDAEEMGRSIRQAIGDEHEILLHEAVLIRERTLPRTSSGKVQRHLCREMRAAGELAVLGQYPAAAAADGGDRTPGLPSRSELAATPPEIRHEILAAGLQEGLAKLLGITAKAIPSDRPLAAFGFDSLLATELKGGLEGEIGVSLPLASMLDTDLDGLVGLVLAAFEEDGQLAPPPARSTPAGIDLPLSYGQKALWFLDRLAPGEAAYHLAGAAAIPGAVDEAALGRALAILVDRHPALRTAFPLVQGEPVQRVTPTAMPGLRVEDATSWSDEALRVRITAEALRPFDLEDGPLLRALLLRRGNLGSVFLLVVHHLVADFWSLALLVHELGTAGWGTGESVAGREAGDEARAAAPRAYSDWVAWQEELLASDRGEELWRFWKAQLAGALGDLELPTDRPRPHVQTFHGGSRGLRLGRELAGSLRALAGGRRATLFMALLSGFEALLHRWSRQEVFTVGTLSSGRSHRWMEEIVGYFVNPLVIRAEPGGDTTGEALLDRVRAQALAAFAHQDYPFALLAERLKPVRDPSRPPLFQVMINFLKAPPAWPQALATCAAGAEGARLPGPPAVELLPVALPTAQMELMLTAAEDADRDLVLSLQHNSDLFDAATADALLRHLRTLLEGLVADPCQPVALLPLLSAGERRELLVERNRTSATYPRDSAVPEIFAAQAERSPEAVAVVFQDTEVTYRELARQATEIAHLLADAAVAPGEPVGIFLERSPDLVASLLGTLAAGACYLPLDPSYPEERLAYMLADSGARRVLTQSALAPRLRRFAGEALQIDIPESRRRGGPELPRIPAELPAYLIYTSGSSGTPKGVVVPHRTVVNFFTGMDLAVGCGPEDTFLALTSISFDISVLELLWTLCRGARVVLLEDEKPVGEAQAQRRGSGRLVDFGLFYFSGNGLDTGREKYRLLLEGARAADAAGLKAVWTPERHFHAFGGLFPNPAVTAAALAASTTHVQIRAGSVVLPLHHPLRVAEDWSVIDNLSGGRAGIAFASGWHADDFVFHPEKYADRKETMFRDVETVRRLWRGETVRLRGGGDEVEVGILPRPLQPELPVWITAAGSEETYLRAGRIGANVLTHLLDQSVEEVAAKVGLYRQARAEAGHDPDQGIVTLMLHTFVTTDRERALTQVRAPFIEYLRTSVGLIRNMVRSLRLPVDLDSLSPRDLDDLLAYAFERYRTNALFGDPASCQELVEELRGQGIDEIACLIDFGVGTDEVLASLPHLAELARRGRDVAPLPPRRDFSLARQCERHRPTLFQCTPSRMQTLLLDARAMASLRSLRTLLLGGEALTPALAREVRSVLPARLINVYGPTETTVWSSAGEVDGRVEGAVAIGRPIANTEIYLLDAAGEPVPPGVAGGLYIGGEGVTCGYLNRPDQTAARFLPDPWSGRPGARLYWTGDLARRRRDGEIEFAGRADDQVKLRGFRIEPGEIETVLAECPAVLETAATVYRPAAGEPLLVAYAVARDAAAPPGEEEMRAFLRSRLPEHMVPSRLLVLEALPRTPNGKLDRHALPPPPSTRPELAGGFVPPNSHQERAIAEIWKEALGLERVGIDDNFFDLGGHSILLAQVHGRLREELGIDLPLVKLLEHPTIGALVRHLKQEEGSGFSLSASQERARRQQEGRRQERVAGRDATP